VVHLQAYISLKDSARVARRVSRISASFESLAPGSSESLESLASQPQKDEEDESFWSCDEADASMHLSARSVTASGDRKRKEETGDIYLSIYIYIITSERHYIGDASSVRRCVI
jgi:hypothetical protein